MNSLSLAPFPLHPGCALHHPGCPQRAGRLRLQAPWSGGWDLRDGVVLPAVVAFADGSLLPGPRHCGLTGATWHPPQPTLPTRRLPSAPPLAVPGVSPARRPPPVGVRLRPLRQRNASSCGQAAVAMAINALTGSRLDDRHIAQRYGYGLLHALNRESRPAGYRWKDGGDLSSRSWPVLEKRLNRERTPVLIGLNGPHFSPSGRGHIVLLLGLDGQRVRYADPADGRIKWTTRQAIEAAPPHPDGKFLFYALRQRPKV